MTYSKEKLLDCACKLGRGLLEDGSACRGGHGARPFYAKAVGDGDPPFDGRRQP